MRCNKFPSPSAKNSSRLPLPIHGLAQETHACSLKLALPSIEIVHHDGQMADARIVKFGAAVWAFRE